jgi:hypothetical protein
MITEIGRLIVQFRRAGPTPSGCHQFETRLQEQLREIGRIIVEWIFNHLEPHERRDLPGQMESQGTWYRRRSKTPNRSVATLCRHVSDEPRVARGSPRRIHGGGELSDDQVSRPNRLGSPEFP